MYVLTKFKLIIIKDLLLKMKSFTESFRGGDLAAIGEDAIDKKTAGDSWWPSLTLRQRVIGFAIWVILGFIFSMLSFGVILAIASGKPARFAIPYTLGVIWSLSGSFFLMGPLRQLKRMFAKTRVLITIVFLLAIVMTLISAFAFKNGWLVLLFVIIQYCAFIWYSLSYIPYARTAVINSLSYYLNKQIFLIEIF